MGAIRVKASGFEVWDVGYAELLNVAAGPFPNLLPVSASARLRLIV